MVFAMAISVNTNISMRKNARKLSKKAINCKFT
jgi:hypothetical protein